VPGTQRNAGDVLAFIRERGPTHPRAVEARFAHGRVTNWFGGTSNAATQLLDGMHYRGLLRVRRRDGGTRVYEAIEHAVLDESASARAVRADTLLDLVVRLYAPLPSASLGYLTSLLINGSHQLRAELKDSLARVRATLPGVQLDGTTWFWPADEKPRSRRYAPDDRVRLLAPFDPIVWDRRRFALLWGWTYRFEAYTPAPRRIFGYYALPLLWRDRVVGWATASVVDGRLRIVPGYANGVPREPAFRRELAAERERMAEFLAL
jgi:hypothetical protein